MQLFVFVENSSLEPERGICPIDSKIGIAVNEFDAWTALQTHLKEKYQDERFENMQYVHRKWILWRTFVIQDS